MKPVLGRHMLAKDVHLSQTSDKYHTCLKLIGTVIESNKNGRLIIL